MDVLRRKPKVSSILLKLFLVLGGLICMIPLFWMIRSSLMDLGEIYVQPPLLWSPQPKWENYQEIFFSQFRFFHYAGNTMKIVLPVWIGTVTTSAISAYGFARFEFPLKKLWFTIILGTMMLPGAVTLIPGFMIWKYLGLINTYYPLIIPSFFGGGAFNIFLMRQFIMGIPRSLDESAAIEGAGYVRIFFTILAPLLRPVFIVVSLFTILGTWNDFLGPLILLYDPKKYTLALSLQVFSSAYGSNFGVVMAGATVTTLPAILLFVLGQKYFVNGMVLSGIK